MTVVQIEPVREICIAGKVNGRRKGISHLFHQGQRMGKEKVRRNKRRSEESYKVSMISRDLKEVLKSSVGEQRTRTVVPLPVSPKREIMDRRIPSTKYLNHDSIINDSQCESLCNTEDGE